MRAGPATAAGTAHAVLLLAPVLVIFVPAALVHRLYWGDLGLYFYPMYAFGASVARTGHVPMWNPYVLGGQPFLGNPQLGVFYPPNWILAWMPVSLGVGVLLLAHACLASLGAYAYLSRWTANRISAVCGAVVFSCSATFIARAQFPPMLEAMAWFPLLMHAVDQCVDRPGRRAAAVTMVSVAGVVMAAHAQVAYLAVGFALCYGVCRLVAARRVASMHPGAGRKSLAAACAGFVAGLGLSAVQLLPVLQLLPESTRERLTEAQANRFVFQPQQLLQLVFPNFFGHPSIANYWGGGNSWEPVVFVGWVPLALGCVALLRSHRRLCVRFWTVAALGAIWLALGDAGGLYAVAFRIVPGLGNFHDPARFVIVTCLSFAMLTAVGLDIALTSHRSRPWLGAAAAIVTAATLVWYAPRWLPNRPAGSANVPRVAATPSVSAAYYPRYVDLWKLVVSFGYADDHAGVVALAGAEQRMMLQNADMLSGTRSAGGYEPVPLAAPAEMDGDARDALMYPQPEVPAWLAVSGTSQLRLPWWTRSTQAYVREGRPSGWLSSDALHTAPDLAWCVSRWRYVAGRQRAEAAVASPAFDWHKEAVVDRPMPTADGVTGSAGIVTSVERSPGSGFRIRVVTPRAALLVVAQSAYPGWVAAEDRRSLPVARADAGVLGAWVPAGSHVVSLDFRPNAYLVGLYISCVSICLVVAAAVAGALRPARTTSA